MPTCCDETSEAETAAATRGGKKKSVRDVLVTTATIMPLCECIQRELTKRQNFKSRFWLKYIAGNRVPVSLSLFFFCNVLPISPPPCYLGRTPMHLRRAFFKVEMHLHVCMPRVNTLHARPSDEMDISGRKWRYTGKWYAVFIPVPLNRNGYLSVRPTYFQKEFVKKDGDFSGGTKVILYVTKRYDIFTLFNVTFSVTRFPTARTSKKYICLRQSTAIWKTRS